MTRIFDPTLERLVATIDWKKYSDFFLNNEGIRPPILSNALMLNIKGLDTRALSKTILGMLETGKVHPDYQAELTYLKLQLKALNSTKS